MRTAARLPIWIAAAAMFVSISEARAAQADEKVLTVAEFAAQHPTQGLYALTAFVVADVYLCPPCPKGAQCKPCIGDNIQISDTLPMAGVLNGQILMVFIAPADTPKFRKGYRYKLTVEADNVPRLRAAQEER